MANFYAIYPATANLSGSVQTVQGEGTPGSQTGGLLTVQGDPSGTPVPISGNITASSASVAPTGMAVPADADYIGINVGGTLTGATGTSNGLNVVVNAAIPAGANIIGAVTQSGSPWGVTGSGTAGTPATGVVTVQGIGSGTAVPVSGSVTATVASVSATGSAVPADADYIGMNVSGTLTGCTGTSSGLNVVVNAAIPAGSNIIGNVRIDQTTPGTTNGVQLTAGSALAGKFGIDQTTAGSTNAIQATSGTTIAWQAEGNIAAGSVTSSYQTIFTPSANTKILFMRNNTNASITVSMDAGTTANFILDSGDQLAIDFIANGVISTTTAIQVKQTSGAPTTGSFRINGGH